MLKSALHQYLATCTGLVALVPAARIYRGRRPAGSPLPAITYWRVSEVDEDHQEGATGLAQARYQFDIWAAADSAAEAIRVELRGALHGLSHTTIGTGAAATAVQGVRLQNTVDSQDWPADGSDVHVRQISIDALVWHETTVPTF